MSIKQAIRALGEQAATTQMLPPAQEVGARNPVRATGRAGSSNGSDAAVDDLVEADYTQREWWAPITWTTSDGYFTFQDPQIKSILLTDGRRIRLAQPV